MTYEVVRLEATSPHKSHRGFTVASSFLPALNLRKAMENLQTFLVMSVFRSKAASTKKHFCLISFQTSVTLNWILPSNINACSPKSSHVKPGQKDGHDAKVDDAHWLIQNNRQRGFQPRHVFCLKEVFVCVCVCFPAPMPNTNFLRLMLKLNSFPNLNLIPVT